MADELEPQLRDELQGTGEPPGWFYTRLAETIRVTPQAHPSVRFGRALATIAAVLVVAVVLTGGLQLYGVITAPQGSATPTAISSSTPSTSPSTTAAPSGAPTARPRPAGSPDVTFDLRGTAWRLLDLPGQTLTSDTTPWLELSQLGDAHQAGFSGCSGFGFTAVFIGGEVRDVSFGAQDPVCRAVAIRDAFMPILAAMTGWAVYGDVLVLSGPAGTLQFERDVPPSGTAGRTLADTLRASHWLISTATGVRTPGTFAALTFTDHWLTSQGDCGFGGQVRFMANGSLDVSGVSWDTTGGGGCDQRPALAAVLNAVASGRIESATTVRLTGPAGDVVLTRDPASPPSPVAALPPPSTIDWPGRPWTFNGQPVATTVISLHPGVAGCPWSSMVFLQFGVQLGQPMTSEADTLQYLRDPTNAWASGDTFRTIGRFASGITPPPDAVFTGYRYDSMELWRSASAGQDVVFLRRGDVWEQWARTSPMFACA